MSLRTRLVAALLALALLPTAVFTLFTLVELDRATQGWFRPGVDRALQSAQQVSRTALTRMEATARAYAVAWKDAVPTGRLDRSTRILAGEELREAGLDFLQIYRRAGGRWVLFEQVLPTGLAPVFALALWGVAAAHRQRSITPGTVAPGQLT